MQIFTLRQHLLKAIEYPPRYLRERLFRTVCIQFGVIFIFLLLFKPFGVYETEHKVAYVLICLLHALFPSLIIYIYFQALSYINRRASKPKVWTSLQEYANLAAVFLLIGIASFLLRGFIYNNPDNWSWRYLWEEVRNCYLAGIFLYFFLLFAGSHFRHNKVADSASSSFAGTSDDSDCETLPSTELFIKTQVQQDDFILIPDQLLFAKAEGNYIQLTVCIDQKVRTELKRIPLKQFEAQLSTYPFLFRCHRAYLVNLLQIKKVSGNTQRYMLTLNMTAEQIPVSRTQIEIFNKQLSCYPSQSLVTGHNLLL